MKKIALFMLTILMVFTLAACGDNVSITKTEAATVETEVYECSDFSMTIPKGWVVTSGGTNIYHSNQMFVLLKADCLLLSIAGKEAWQSNYEMRSAQAEMMAKAPVLSNPSTEGLFKIFGKYTDFVSDVEPSYAGYEFPRFDNFNVTSLSCNLIYCVEIHSILFLEVVEPSPNSPYPLYPIDHTVPSFLASSVL